MGRRTRESTEYVSSAHGPLADVAARTSPPSVDSFLALTLSPTPRQQTPVIRRSLAPDYSASASTAAKSTFDFPLYRSLAEGGYYAGRGLEVVVWDKVRGERCVRCQSRADQARDDAIGFDPERVHGRSGRALPPVVWPRGRRPDARMGRGQGVGALAWRSRSDCRADTIARPTRFRPSASRSSRAAGAPARPARSFSSLASSRPERARTCTRHGPSSRPRASTRRVG